MKIAKEFKWEMGHRLPFHKGKCRNLHGHTYRCIVEIDGTTDQNGMVLDYYELKRIIDPIIEEMDHSFIVSSKDTELINLLRSLDSKAVVVDFDSTAENICIYLLDRIKKAGLPDNINKVKVRVMETENSYAEEELSLM